MNCINKIESLKEFEIDKSLINECHEMSHLVFESKLKDLVDETLVSENSILFELACNLMQNKVCDFFRDVQSFGLDYCINKETNFVKGYYKESVNNNFETILNALYESIFDSFNVMFGKGVSFE